MEQQLSFSELIEFYRVERLPSDEMIYQLGVVARSIMRFHSLDNVINLKYETILGWRDWLLQGGASRATWNNYHRHLRALLNYAVDTGRMASSPLDGIQSLADYNRRKKSISAQDTKKLLEFLMSEKNDSLQPGWFWHTVIRFLYYSGVRRKQLVSMTWGDIDWDRMIILLVGEGSKNKREWEIPLPKACKEDLETLQMMTSQTLGRPVKRCEQVFNVTQFNPRYEGNEMSKGQVSGFFRRLKNKTGIPVSPHKFRHSFGRQAARTGKYRPLQAQLGHTDVRTTMEYVEPDIEDMRNLQDSLEPI